MVSTRPVGRPRTGKARKDQSVTAVRAYIASHLAGRLDQSFLADDLGVALNTTAVRRAGRARHWRPPGYRPRGRASGTATTGTQPSPPSAFRDWLAVDASVLDLGLGLITLVVTTARNQRDVYRRMSKLAGVVQLFAAGNGKNRRVVGLVLTDGEADRRRLRAELDELDDDWSWDVIDHETVEPGLQTWRHLVQQAAAREALRL